MPPSASGQQREAAPLGGRLRSTGGRARGTVATPPIGCTAWLTARTPVRRSHGGVHGGENGKLCFVDVLLCEPPSLSPVHSLRERLQRLCGTWIPRRPKRRAGLLHHQITPLSDVVERDQVHREDDSRTHFLKTHPGQTNAPHSPQRSQRAQPPLFPALRSSPRPGSRHRGGHSGAAVLRKRSSRGRVHVLRVSRHAARQGQGETASGAANSSCPQGILNS